MIVLAIVIKLVKVGVNIHVVEVVKILVLAVLNIVNKNDHN